MKKCPYCAEEIQDEAIVCRYCGRDLLSPIKSKSSLSAALIALFGGLLLALLALMPKLLDNSPSLNDLIFHFISNTIIWGGVIFLFIKLWTYKAFKIIFLILLSLGILYFIIGNGNYQLTSFLPLEGIIQNSTSQRIQAKPTFTPRPIVTPSRPKATNIIYYTSTPNTNAENTLSAIYTKAAKTRESKISLGDVMSTNHAKKLTEGYIPGSPVFQFRKVCTYWNSPDDSDGDSVCVFGNIARIELSDQYVQVISFKEFPDGLQIRGHDESFDWVQVGMCVEARGIVRSDDSQSYMYADEIELSHCK